MSSSRQPFGVRDAVAAAKAGVKTEDAAALEVNATAALETAGAVPAAEMTRTRGRAEKNKDLSALLRIVPPVDTYRFYQVAFWL